MLLMESIFGNDNCNGLANGLLSRVAEDSLGTPIPASDDTIEVLAHNRVVTDSTIAANKRKSLSRAVESLFVFVTSWAI